jgi:hypothetical protein
MGLLRAVVSGLAALSCRASDRLGRRRAAPLAPGEVFDLPAEASPDAAAEPPAKAAWIAVRPDAAVRQDPAAVWAVRPASARPRRRSFTLRAQARGTAGAS